MNEVERLKTLYKFKKETMKEYLLLKIEEEDWHGVADAAMDIRELVTEERMVEKYRREINDTTAKVRDNFYSNSRT